MSVREEGKMVPIGSLLKVAKENLTSWWIGSENAPNKSQYQTSGAGVVP